MTTQPIILPLPYAARWQHMLVLPSSDSRSSQRVATASSVGVTGLVEWPCVTLYRRQPRSGSSRKPSSYWGMILNPVRTAERFTQHWPQWTGPRYFGPSGRDVRGLCCDTWPIRAAKTLVANISPYIFTLDDVKFITRSVHIR
jgi:hypothetical protein